MDVHAFFSLTIIIGTHGICSKFLPGDLWGAADSDSRERFGLKSQQPVTKHGAPASSPACAAPFLRMRIGTGPAPGALGYGPVTGPGPARAVRARRETGS